MLANQRTDPQRESSDSEISVKISAAKNTLRAGQSLTLHVEIWNEGPRDTFIFKSVDPGGGDNGSLRILLYYGSEVDGPSEVSVGDYLPRKPGDPRNPPLAQELVKYWVAVPPGHFYGTELVLSPTSYGRLTVPGKYLVKGRYSSLGFFVPDDFGNPLYAYMDELKHLPYQAWAGQVETNSLWIEVAKPAKEKHQ